MVTYNSNKIVLNQNMIKLTIPPLLKNGDTIGIISPSAGLHPFCPHRTFEGEKTLKKLGYKVKYAPHSLENNGYVSTSPQKRVDDLHQMFLDKEVTAIICSLGGENANQLLKYIDFSIIKNNPKIFLGYSDITILHCAFASQSQLRTYYGPTLQTEFAEYPDIDPYVTEYFNKAIASNKVIGKINPSKEWSDEFLNWFTKEDQKRKRTPYPHLGYEWLKEGHAEGSIFGGCIPTLNHLAGTKYWIDPTDTIFFIDIPEGAPGQQMSLSALDAFFADLENIGVFQNIKGLLVGRPYQFKEDSIEKLKEILLYYTADHNYPILFNANIGHASPIITIPLGASCNIDSRNNLFEITESGVV